MCAVSIGVPARLFGKKPGKNPEFFKKVLGFWKLFIKRSAKSLFLTNSGFLETFSQKVYF
jgi:hypothetical protein